MKSFNEWINNKENIIFEEENIISNDSMVNSVPKSAYTIMSSEELKKKINSFSNDEKDIINKKYLKDLEKLLSLAELSLRYRYVESIMCFNKIFKILYAHNKSNLEGKSSDDSYVKDIEILINKQKKFDDLSDKIYSDCTELSRKIINKSWDDKESKINYNVLGYRKVYKDLIEIKEFIFNKYNELMKKILTDALKAPK